MNVTLLQIDTHTADATAHGQVRVEIEIDGVREWHAIRVEASILPGHDANLLVASPQLQERFRDDQVTLHLICRLVSRELRGRAVRVPQLLAA